jgi:hypothetical protein
MVSRDGSRFLFAGEFEFLRNMQAPTRRRDGSQV